MVLGDLLELRERRADEVLELAAPVLAAIGAALEGREIVLAPGNHDYELVSPALEGARLDGRDLEREGTLRGGRRPALAPGRRDAGPRARRAWPTRACGCATTSGPRTATTPTCT